jgi:hypothetical protein
MELQERHLEMDLYSVCLKLLRQMSRNITAPPGFTMEVTRVSMLMIWVLDVVRFVMHQMLLIDLLGGVLVLVSVICHNRKIGLGVKGNAGFVSFTGTGLLETWKNKKRWKIPNDTQEWKSQRKGKDETHT